MSIYNINLLKGLLTSCSSDGYIKMWRPFANDGEIELFDFKSNCFFYLYIWNLYI